MDRIIAPNTVAAAQADTAPATGTPAYATDGNPASNVLATQWPAYQYNAIQEELMAVILAAGITADRTNNAQLLAAIKALRGSSSILADTGVANAYTAVNATPLVAGTWVGGVVQQVKIAHANTGASTYAPDGLAAIPIYGLGLQPLQGGELALNGTAILMRATIAGVNSGNPICVLMECAGGAQQTAPATGSQHAVQLGQLYGTAKGIARFTSSGSFTAPVTGTYYLSGCGAGGGGGSSLATNAASFITGGSGGGAGQPAIRVPVNLTAGQVVPITIGTGGTGGTAATNNATAGGATQFGTAGAILNLAGGSPGSLGGGGTATNSAYGGPTGGAGFPNGGAASDTVSFSSPGAANGWGGMGGLGASGPFGTSGPPGRGASGSSPPALAGTGFGAGGSGSGGAYSSAVTNPGGAGAAGLPGFAMIEW